MRGKRIGLVIFLALGVAMTGCSDDDGPGPGNVDQGVKKKDGKVDPQKDGKVNTPDMPPPAPDMTIPKACEAKCLAKYVYYCTYKTGSTTTCVECNNDNHCKSNPGSFGAKCDTTKNQCTCAADADCKGKLHGTKCKTAQKLCGCATDSECGQGYVCGGTMAGTKVCSKRCYSKSDCTSYTAPLCDTSSGKCVKCFTNAQCTSSTASKCDKTTGMCTSCTANADCSHYGFGGKCEITSGKGTCTCKVNADCKTYQWGNQCVKSSTTSTTGSCGCTANTDCTGNPNGPTCYTTFKKCSCSKDAECTKAPYTKCALPYSSAAYKHCQKPCKSNDDCNDSTLKTCDTGTGKCVACKNDADCTSSTAKYCSAKLGKCVACKTSADCTSSSYPICDTATGACKGCNTNADCAKNLNGGMCNSGSCVCKIDGDCKTGYAWGGKCTSTGSRCGCKANTDCAANANGPTCYTTYNKCSCKNDAECTKAPYSKCYLPYSTATYMHCQKACKTNADCTGSGLTTCDTGTGKCVACKKDADCTSSTAKYCSVKLGKCVACKTKADCTSTSYPYCLASTGSCVKCMQDTHCASSTTYPFCDGTTGSCVACKNDANCKIGVQWGNKCIKGSYSSSCGCKLNGDCVGNPNGLICDTSYSKCTCTSDAQCKKAPYTKCGIPNTYSSYMYCQKPCTKDADCPSTALKCNVSSGKCGECFKDADCTSTTYKYCKVTTGKCVACKTSKDCTSASYPYCDVASGKCGECGTDAQCKTNIDGGKCVSGSCSCKADADCKTGYAWGNVCDSTYSRCGCKANATCANNVNGPTCYTTFNKCSCTTNADCKNATYKTCKVPYSGAAYKHCQK